MCVKMCVLNKPMGGFSSSGKYTIRMPKRHVVFIYSHAKSSASDERKYILYYRYNYTMFDGRVRLLKYSIEKEENMFGQGTQNVCKDIKKQKKKNTQAERRKNENNNSELIYYKFLFTLAEFLVKPFGNIILLSVCVVANWAR